ncbi:peptidoglycan-binding protein [Streptomyces sp. NBC_00201]|uniref:peptidoglycan-binding domain-containing protein n=1 Tax=unclassified Streptomyces TaxID=2593676 RepID=UPI0022564C8B|nr:MULTISPECIES: peptidoglycan-binding domain-containing protein [unclassified Streptomyces]MCX5060234.1 peptidoglycan-binding protein [Streptomyces sp. NBC_00452]MCX5247716.1 peptidoglycan-binding protein [Streptomyces sp. NBC_00201]MCX5286474.1 peptidoglycan-binding protein [Streptomyces sp. NBC_00183]
MRRAFIAAATLILPLALSGGPAAATSQDTPPSVTAQATSAQAAQAARHPGTLVAQGPDDICGYTNRRPNLRRGSEGRAVRQAQCYLNQAIGTNLAQDGDFGRATRNATRFFQECADITVDGRIGAQTWSFLSFWANQEDAPFDC